jgi:uncharacterized membrane protein (UPF0182 family)
MSNHRFSPRQHRIWGVFILAIAAILVLLAVISNLVVKWLWMRNLDYAEIFWTILSTQWSLGIIGFLIAFLYVWINLRIVVSKAGRGESSSQGIIDVIPASGGGRSLAFYVSAVIGLIFGLILYSQWDTYIRFHYGGPFGLSDPLFGVDAGFYVFRLPFYELLQNSLNGLALTAFFLVLFGYSILGVLQAPRNWKVRGTQAVLPHLVGLLIVVVGSWGWGFFLDRFDLLYSSVGVVYGAGYTAWHITRIALSTMIAASVLLCALFAVSLFRPKLKLIVSGGSAYIVLYIAGIVLLPGLVQKFSVQPNELEMETPYLRHNIEFTRKAFDLKPIREVKYPALSDLTQKEIAENGDTIRNVRLWDWRPLLQTYRQTQEIRLYYQFYDVDVDRYHLPDGYHQVMLSVRELASELPEKASTWVNEYLQFTHGYGIVMSFVSKVIGDGFPEFLLENIPPESNSGLTVSQPAVYYGEKTPGYRIVATGIKEFDYPKGDQNVYTSYEGKGGIPLDSIWRRLLFAWSESDINILLTSYLKPQSRIQIWRDVRERVGTIAPFLSLDRDPYAVLSNNRLYWIQDAYTVSDHFPYSSPHARGYSQEINYIRNSVKVVLDMYDGTVSFYVIDPNDPIVSAYSRAFPGIFRDLNEMSKDLRQHLRYPEDLFVIQADQYRMFHMTVPQVYYNQEDLWEFPNEKYTGQTITMDPYYILMKLPGSDRLEYLLMLPFTPEGRDNMIAWMAAKCDPEDYGKMLVYQLPKEKLIYGPLQIEAMIDQNALISQQLSLWDQRGSRVIRGNLIVIPIENSFMYVEPVYLTAEGTNIPQLKRVIVVSGDKVVMEPTLEESINTMFGTAQQQTPPGEVKLEPQLITKAKEQFEDVRKAMQKGDWQAFGRAMQALGQLLK